MECSQIPNVWRWWFFEYFSNSNVGEVQFFGAYVGDHSIQWRHMEEPSFFFFVGNFTLLQNLGIFCSPNKNHPKNEKIKIKIATFLYFVWGIRKK
jgi:hypothetical protein